MFMELLIEPKPIRSLRPPGRYAGAGPAYWFHLTLSCVLSVSICLLLTSGSVLAQGNIKDLLYKPDTTVYTIVEKQPEFPGGLQSLSEYMQTNVQYPDQAAKAKIKGKVYTTFIVEPDGRLTDMRIMQGLGYGCDEEAIRVVKAMPSWKPGSQSGRPLRTKYTLPIAFGPK